VTKSRRDWQGVWHTDSKALIRFLDRNPKVRDLLEVLGVDKNIILKGILKKQSSRPWTGFVWLRIG
jgi:hypothetical protein